MSFEMEIWRRVDAYFFAGEKMEMMTREEINDQRMTKNCATPPNPALQTHQVPVHHLAKFQT